MDKITSKSGIKGFVLFLNTATTPATEYVYHAKGLIDPTDRKMSERMPM